MPRPKTPPGPVAGRWGAWLQPVAVPGLPASSPGSRPNSQPVSDPLGAATTAVIGARAGPLRKVINMRDSRGVLPHPPCRIRAASFAPASTPWRAQICHFGAAQARSGGTRLGFRCLPRLLPWFPRRATGFLAQLKAPMPSAVGGLWPGPVRSCFLKCVLHGALAAEGPAPRPGPLECHVSYARAQRRQNTIAGRGARHIGGQPLPLACSSAPAAASRRTARRRLSCSRDRGPEPRGSRRRLVRPRPRPIASAFPQTSRLVHRDILPSARVRCPARLRRHATD
jgi:hypothetical protein